MSAPKKDAFQTWSWLGICGKNLKRNYRVFVGRNVSIGVMAPGFFCGVFFSVVSGVLSSRVITLPFATPPFPCPRPRPFPFPRPRPRVAGWSGVSGGGLSSNTGPTGLGFGSSVLVGGEAKVLESARARREGGLAVCARRSG